MFYTDNMINNCRSWNYKKSVVDRFYDWCKENSQGISLWKDDRDGINDHVNDDMAIGVEDSHLVLAFVSESYFMSKNCHKELNYAEQLDKKIVIVKSEKDMELLGRGSLSLISCTKLYVRNLRLSFH